MSQKCYKNYYLHQQQRSWSLQVFSEIYYISSTLESLSTVHSQYRVPRPMPREISSIVDVNEILAVNEDDKTMTVSLYLILEWNDPQIDIKVPETK